MLNDAPRVTDPLQPRVNMHCAHTRGRTGTERTGGATDGPAAPHSAAATAAADFWRTDQATEWDLRAIDRVPVQLCVQKRTQSRTGRSVRIACLLRRATPISERAPPPSRTMLDGSGTAFVSVSRSMRKENPPRSPNCTGGEAFLIASVFSSPEVISEQSLAPGRRWHSDPLSSPVRSGVRNQLNVEHINRAAAHFTRQSRCRG